METLACATKACPVERGTRHTVFGIGDKVVRLADLAQLLVRLDPRRPLLVQSIKVSLE